jgi:hypothetical protein
MFPKNHLQVFCRKRKWSEGNNMKAMIFKEIRENVYLAILAIVVVAWMSATANGIPKLAGRGENWEHPNEGIYFWLGLEFIIVGATIALLAGSSFASDREHKTWEFIAAQPISGAGLWLSKTAVSLTSVLLILLAHYSFYSRENFLDNPWNYPCILLSVYAFACLFGFILGNIIQAALCAIIVTIALTLLLLSNSNNPMLNPIFFILTLSVLAAGFLVMAKGKLQRK